MNISNILTKIGTKKNTFSTSIPNMVCASFPAIFLLGTTALEIHQPGYNRITDTISELVWGPAGWIENVLFLAFAVALSILALRIRAVFAPIAVAALGFVIISIFPTQAPGADPTLGSLIHQYSAQGIALALPLACFLLAKKLENNEENGLVIICSLTAGTMGVILNLAGLLAVYGETSWIGAAERLVMFNGLLWLQIIAVHLWLQGKLFSAACCVNHDRKSGIKPRVVRQAVQPVRVTTLTPTNHQNWRSR